MTPSTTSRLAKAQGAATLVLAAAAAIATTSNNSLSAQCQGDLLYTTSITERSNQCTVAGTSINRVRSNSLQIVRPNPALAYRSASYMPRAGYDALLGDGDADGVFNEPMLFGGIDATVLPRDPAGALLPLDKTRVFFSTKTSVTDTTGNTMSPADIGRIRAGGRLERLITGNMIRNAFGIPGTEPIDIDAAALGFRPGAGFDLYLSLEDTEDVNVAPFGVIPMQDGAILRIPAGGMTFGVSPYDGAVIITGTAALSGQIVADEGFLNAFCAISNIADAAGVGVSSVGDCDGLVLDPAGGTWNSQWNPNPIPHLMFSGRNLTGGGIVSTQASGSIAVLNGMPLGSSATTTGAQVGLVTISGVQSLAGLSIAECGQSRLSLDTPTPVLSGGGNLDLDIGGSAPGGAIMTIGLGCNTVGCVNVGVPVFNPDYPALIAPSVFFFQPTGADGCGTLSLFLPPAVASALGGQNLVFQAIDPTGPGHLSNPVNISF